MSIFAFVHLPSGEISQITSTIKGTTDLKDQKIINDYIVFDVTERADVQESRHLFYCKDNLLLQRDPAPSPFYRWSLSEERWIFDSGFFFEKLRFERANLLALSDWTQMQDAPLSEAEKQEWQLYRQKLRDLPETNKDKKSWEEVIWPVAPNQQTEP